VSALRRGRWAALLTAFLVCATHAGIEQRLRVCAGCHGADGNSMIAGVPSLAAQPRVFLENYLVLTREGIRGSEVMQQLLKGVTDAEVAALAKHYSAMPARPGPGGMSRALYERGREVAQQNRCGTCHLPNYRGREQIPRLAGQREDFLAEAMLAYRRNLRRGGDTIMAASLHGIAETDLKALAHYFSRLR
jgi:cytochrome c553